MERKRNKAINFDLDTNKMKEMNVQTKEELLPEEKQIEVSYS